MKFTIEVTDQEQLDWIEFARIEYNLNNPQNQLVDAQGYFEWAVQGWFTSGSLQMKNTKLDRAVQKYKEGSTTDLEVMVAKK